MLEAEDYLRLGGIRLWGVNVNPDQDTWSTSPKAHCNVFIDDKALGCPLIYDVKGKKKPFVDWIGVREQLEGEGIL